MYRLGMLLTLGSVFFLQFSFDDILVSSVITVSPDLWICHKLVCKVTASHGLWSLEKEDRVASFCIVGLLGHKDSHGVTSHENMQTGTPLAGHGPEGGALQWQTPACLSMFGAAAARGAGTARGEQRVGKRVPGVPGWAASVPRFLAFLSFVPAPPWSLLAEYPGARTREGTRAGTQAGPRRAQLCAPPATSPPGHATEAAPSRAARAPGARSRRRRARVAMVTGGSHSRAGPSASAAAARQGAVCG